MSDTAATQQRVSSTPFDNGRGSPGQVFFGSHW